MKKLSIYFTPTHSNIEVEGTVCRSASGRQMSDVIDNMHDADREALVTFCAMVIRCADRQITGGQHGS